MTPVFGISRQTVAIVLTGLLLILFSPACRNNFLNVVGNKIAEEETIAPTAGGGGVLTFKEIRADSLLVGWSKATDNFVEQSRLEYKVFYSSNNDIGSVKEAEANGLIALDWTVDIDEGEIDGLSVATTYYVSVLVRDVAGNRALYTMATATTTADTTGPQPGAAGDLTFSNIGENSITVNWTKGSDNITVQSSLAYLVVYSRDDNIGTVAEAEANTEGGISYSTDIDSFPVSGLIDFETYYFNVIIQDGSFNKALYSQETETTLKTPRIYYVNRAGTEINRVELDGTGKETVLDTGSVWPRSIALDVDNRILYWGSDDGSIYRANMDGTSNTEIVSGEGGIIAGLAVDASTGKIFWTVPNSTSIRRADVDGKNKTSLSLTVSVTNPFGIALHTGTGRVYWSDLASPSTYISGADQDGSNDAVVNSGATSEPRHVAVDPTYSSGTGRIFWSDGTDYKIYAKDLPGGGITETEILSTSDRPWAIAVDAANAKLYWSEVPLLEAHVIKRRDISGGTVDSFTGLGDGIYDLELDL